MQELVNGKPDGPVVRADVAAVTRALAAPFDAREVKFKPAVVTGSRALALAYVDARVIQDRLDEVLGVEGWQDDYEFLPDGSVVCRLRVRLGDEWLTKVDVGGPSEQPDDGDRRKAAVSDALKRAAVKFGVGRYLYRLPSQWVDYDPHKKQFVRPPTLPAVALPPKAPPAAAKGKLADAAPAPAKKTAVHALPASGAELQRRLAEYDAKLAAQGLCAKGDLLEHVADTGEKAGHGRDLAAWAGPTIGLAVEATKAFEAQLRSRPEKAVA
jgi:hypothetical protein